MKKNDGMITIIMTANKVIRNSIGNNDDRKIVIIIVLVAMIFEIDDNIYIYILKK